MSLKKPENPQMIQAERVGDKVLSTLDELLDDRGKQWTVLWTKGTNKIGEISSAHLRIKEMAHQVG